MINYKARIISGVAGEIQQIRRVHLSQAIDL
jgi:hypothetical protein